MAQVVSLLCFGHALNTHILPPNTVPSPTDTYPIAAQFLVLYCTFVTVYSSVYHSWNTVVAERLDSLIGTTLHT